MKRTKITAVRNEKYVTQNVSLFKPVKVDWFADKGGDKCKNEGLSDLNSDNDTQVAQNKDDLQNIINPTSRYPVRECRQL